MLKTRPFRLIGAAILLALLSACGSQSPSSVVKDAILALEKGEITEAKSYMDYSVKNAQNEGRVSAAMSAKTVKIKRHGGISNVEITKEDVTGEVADISYVIHFKDGSNIIDSDRLIKTRSGWKISLQ